MIVVDTNVVSEAIRPLPSGEVLRWMATQPGLELFTTSITVAELLYGVHLLPPGKRRTALQYEIENKLNDFADRILSFDRDAAGAFADIFASLESLDDPSASWKLRSPPLLDPTAPLSPPVTSAIFKTAAYR